MKVGYESEFIFCPAEPETDSLRGGVEDRDYPRKENQKFALSTLSGNFFHSFCHIYILILFIHTSTLLLHIISSRNPYFFFLPSLLLKHRYFAFLTHTSPVVQLRGRLWRSAGQCWFFGSLLIH